MRIWTLLSELIGSKVAHTLWAFALTTLFGRLLLVVKWPRKATGISQPTPFAFVATHLPDEILMTSIDGTVEWGNRRCTGPVGAEMPISYHYAPMVALAIAHASSPTAMPEAGIGRAPLVLPANPPSCM
jgi:hypothetical protein